MKVYMQLPIHPSFSPSPSTGAHL